MSNNPIPISKFLFRNEWKPLTEAINIVPAYNTTEQASNGDLVNYLTVEPSALIITAVADKNDLIQLASFVKTSKKFGKEIVFKVVVVNFSANKEIEKAIQKLGILDLVEPGVSTKALRFKIDFWMKALNAQVKARPAQNVVKSLKPSDTTNSTEKKSLDGQMSWAEPLDLESDIWLIKNESDYKKVLNKWLIKLFGPSPYVGSWVEVQGKTNLWKFEVKSHFKDLLISGDGVWYFQGDQKPDFLHKENRWLLTGENFNLFFKDSAIHSRLEFKDKALKICKNSDYAKTKEQVIIESFNQELIFKQESEAAKTSDYKDQKEVAQLKNLEGKGKTDQLAGNLSGKNTSDVSATDPLRGKSSTDISNQSHYTGEIDKSLNKSSAPELKATQERGSQNQIPDFRNSDAKKSNPELSIELEKSKDSPLLKAPSSQETSGPLSGKNKTDSVNAKPLAGTRAENKVERHETHYKSHDSHLKPQAPLRDIAEIEREEKAKSAGLELAKRKAREKTQKALTDLEKSLSNNVIHFAPQAEKPKTFSEDDPELEAALETPEITSFISQENVKFECKIDDHFDQTIFFITPQAGVESDKKVILDLSFKYRKDSKQLRFSGEVKTINEDDEGLRYIEVEINQENVGQFNSFMDMYKARQESVDVFLKRAKGF